jgi:hypothetical protein
MCGTCFIVETMFVLPTRCIYLCHMILKIKTVYFLQQHRPINLCNINAVYFLWGINWIFEYYLDEHTTWVKECQKTPGWKIRISRGSRRLGIA